MKRPEDNNELAVIVSLEKDLGITPPKQRYEIGNTCCEKYGEPIIEHGKKPFHTDICGDYQPHVPKA